jgi:3-isopropylmalate dehydrogenase
LRELTGGIILVKKEEEDGGETAYDTCTYTRSEVQRLEKVLN